MRLLPISTPSLYQPGLCLWCTARQNLTSCLWPVWHFTQVWTVKQYPLSWGHFIAQKFQTGRTWGLPIPPLRDGLGPEVLTTNTWGLGRGFKLSQDWPVRPAGIHDEEIQDKNRHRWWNREQRHMYWYKVGKLSPKWAWAGSNQVLRTRGAGVDYREGERYEDRDGQEPNDSPRKLNCIIAAFLHRYLRNDGFVSVRIVLLKTQK